MDTKQAKLIGNIAKLAIALIGSILTVMIVWNGNESVIDTTIKLTMGVLVLCAAIALIFGVVRFVTNIGKSKGALIGLVGFAIILGIAFSMSGSEVLDSWREAGITEEVSKRSEMGVRAVLILLGLTIATAVYAEISKLIKG